MLRERSAQPSKLRSYNLLGRGHVAISSHCPASIHAAAIVHHTGYTLLLSGASVRCMMQSYASYPTFSHSLVILMVLDPYMCIIGIAPISPSRSIFSASTSGRSNYLSACHGFSVFTFSSTWILGIRDSAWSEHLQGRTAPGSANYFLLH